VVLSAAVSGDGGIPLISETHDGNTSDSVLPVPYWERLRKLTQKNNFCLIGDCKVASLKTIKEICTEEGKFLAPLPLTVKEKKELKDKLQNNELKFSNLEIQIEDQLLPIYEHERNTKTTKQKEKENWSAEKLLSLYKRQYKVEKKFSVLKGPLSVTPMLLEKPNRICSMLFIMTLTLQLYTLIQREASNELFKRKEYLEGVMPNNIKTCRPKSDKILSLFENIMLIKVERKEGKEIIGITKLNNTHLKILEILSIPKEVYSIEYYYKLPVNT
jgi:transposase